MNNDLSKSGPSTEIMDILKVTTDAAKSKPDESQINVPSDVTYLNNNFIVSRKVSAFFAYDNNNTDVTTKSIPTIIGNEIVVLKINVSKNAINTTSVLENAIPAAKLL